MPSILNTHRWIANHNALVCRGFPTAEAQAFARGHLALTGHAIILSEPGKELLAQAEHLLNSLQPASVDVMANIFDELVPEFPTLANPHLHLFISPTASLSRKAKRAIKALMRGGKDSYRILQLTIGCPNQCLMCELAPPSRMIQMPYPMALKIAKSFFAEEEGFLTYYDSEMFAYRDIFFDADYSDILFAFRRMGIHPQGGVTHGWWAGDKYAQRAAEKFQAAGFPSPELSVHLYHRQIADNLDQPDELDGQIDLFVARFQEAIRLLRPARVRLLHGYLIGQHEVWTGQFIKKLYEQRVVQGIKNPPPWYWCPIHLSGRALTVAAGLEHRQLSPGTINPAGRKPERNIVFRPTGKIMLETKKLKLDHKIPVTALDEHGELVTRRYTNNVFHQRSFHRRQLFPSIYSEPPLLVDY